jgi:acyl-CoA reductase-like NAD-dependent aldehyde dehydrogenase
MSPPAGLSAGVWGDEEQAIEIARELDAGMVWINDWHVIHPAYPFGGFKQSGLGREGGPHALDEYTEAKFISLNRSPGPEARAFAIVIDPV